MPLSSALQVETVVAGDIPGEIGKCLRNKIEKIEARNPGLMFLRHVNKMLQGESEKQLNAYSLICLMQFAMAVTYCMLYLETVERSTQDAGVYLMLLGIAFCKVCLLLLPALVLFHMGLKSGSISNISYSLDLQILWLTIQAIEILVGHALHTKWELTIAEAAAFVILSYFTLVTYCFWKAQRANQMSPDLSDREGTDESSVVEAFASREQFVPQRSVSGIQQISPRA